MTTMDDVRAHIEWLRENGMTQRHIGNLVGLSHAAISKCVRGRPLSPRIADHVMRIHPDDAELADEPAPGLDEQIEEEYDHFVGRMGWRDSDFAALMADELGLAVETVRTKIRAIQRARSPVGLSRSEADQLSGVAFTGELTMQMGHSTRVLEGRGLIETFVWRGKGHVRYAVLTEEGAEALRKERQCQS